MSDAHEILRFLKGQRATRQFSDQPIPDAVLEDILEVGRWTGSARNRQPWRFGIVTDPVQRARLAKLGAYAQHLAGAPVVIVLAIDVRTGGADAEFDAGRLAQNLMLAAHGFGLGTCPATFFPDVNSCHATRFAGLADPWRVRTAIGMGYPAPRPAGGRSAIPTGRLPLEILSLRLPTRGTT